MGSDEICEYISRVIMELITKYGTLSEGDKDPIDFDYIDECIVY